MKDNSNLKSYLYISKKKISISVNSSNDKKVYFKEFFGDNKLNELSLNDLDYFLSENIFEIEKSIDDFIKKICIILDTRDFFTFGISIKKNNFENVERSKKLVHLLNDAQNYCKKTLDQKRIVHMIIENYNIDSKNYLQLPKNITEDVYSIDVKFICLPDNLLKNYEEILGKYQVSLNQIVNASYIHEYISNGGYDIFEKTQKILDGHNPNEILLVEKSPKNGGFFEKFFNFFN